MCLPISAWTCKNDHLGRRKISKQKARILLIIRLLGVLGQSLFSKELVDENLREAILDRK